ncbi:MAG: hypothetical protein JXQ90_18025 [Cyclobacteriaceae bacterium]
MKNLFAQLLKRKDYVTFNVNTNDMIKKWSGIAREYKAIDIPIQDVVHQAELEFSQFELGIHANYYTPIREIEFDTDDDKKELDDMNTRFDDYAKAEKAGMSDKLFATIDKLKARFAKMKAQAEEQENYSKQIKS